MLTDTLHAVFLRDIHPDQLQSKAKEGFDAARKELTPNGSVAGTHCSHNSEIFILSRCAVADACLDNKRRRPTTENSPSVPPTIKTQLMIDGHGPRDTQAAAVLFDSVVADLTSSDDAMCLITGARRLLELKVDLDHGLAARGLLALFSALTVGATQLGVEEGSLIFKIKLTQDKAAGLLAHDLNTLKLKGSLRLDEPDFVRLLAILELGGSGGRSFDDRVRFIHLDDWFDARNTFEGKAKDSLQREETKLAGHRYIP